MESLKAYASSMGLVLQSRSGLALLAKIINEKADGFTARQLLDGTIVIDTEDLDSLKELENWR